jgi:hypothetical protein
MTVLYGKTREFGRVKGLLHIPDTTVPARE